MGTKVGRRLHQLLAGVGCASCLLLGVSAAPASGQGTGFTNGIVYNCNLLPEAQNCGPTTRHSYGFNSVYYSGNGRWYIRAILSVPGADFAAETDGPGRIARVCLFGRYPNCQDYDGYAGRVFIRNVRYRHSIQGHGVW